MDASRPAQATNALGVLAVFLKLGLTSFGGPVAHIGSFRREFVERRRWLDDATFTDLVGLCQFLPGPASSQVGFSIGLLRAGWLGGLAAWCGFTLPSVVLLIAFAMLAPTLGGPLGDGLIHGLKLVAVAVVAQAVWDMARRLCPDLRRAGIALAAIVLLGLTASVYAQLIAIALGAVLGMAVIARVRDYHVGRGTTKGEASWILEDNMPMRRMIESFNCLSKILELPFGARAAVF